MFAGNRRVFTLLLAAALAPACESDECDPGQVYADGLCYPAVDAAPADGSTDAGIDAAGDPFAHYGDVCEETSECGAPTDYCAIQPGDTVGFCTHTGCVEDETVCPPDCGCLDLGMFDPKLPSICTQP
jgi:hypothetical protein